ncbi:MAG: 5-formyltetrahydrofolate cyclo-ligase, partial [Algoriphagus sp.]
MNRDKQELRRFYKQRRAAMSAEEIEGKSLQITDQVISFLKERETLNHFHLFFPISRQREVNTFPLKDFLESRGSVLYTAKVAPDTLILQTLRQEPKTTFLIDQWGIPVPRDFEVVESEAIQVVFIPLLAYDQKGNRIGFGKGYYDVYLSSLSPHVLKIGLSFFEP